MTTYMMSHLREEDLPGVVSVIHRSRKGLPFERTLSVDEMRIQTTEDSDFRADGSWLAHLEGEPVAFAWAVVEANRLSAGLDDACVEFEVVPEERGKGLEQQLIGLSSEYIRSRGVGKARARCMSTDLWRRDALVSEGFSEAYRVFFLVRKGREEVPPVPVPEGMRFVRRPYKDCGDDELTRIVDAFNDTFQDHFGFAPENPEKFIQYRDVSEDEMMLSLGMSGDRIIGVCLSEESRVYNRESGERIGWVNVLGVRPPHRRRGVARFLLADGMRWILDKGMDTLHIGVYAKNETALGLYKSLGFEKSHESVWFEKNLR